MQLLLVIVLNIGSGVLGEEEEDFASSLYLYDETEHVFKKSESVIPKIEVVKAGMTGTGCFLLFEKENFDCLIHKVGILIDYQCSRGSVICSCNTCYCYS